MPSAPAPGGSSSRRSRESESPDPQKASRACEKCTRTKKKCDKALPACGRCSRLGQSCTYDFIYTPPAMTIVDHSTLANHARSSSLGDPALTSASLRQKSLALSEMNYDLSGAAIMSNLRSWNIKWREAVTLYMANINLHIHIVEPSVFEKRVANVGDEGPVHDNQLALLILCMHLATIFADSGRSQTVDSSEMFNRPEYIYTKRMVNLVKSFAEPSIILLQCCALLAGFEFSHGGFAKAYFSIGDCATYIMWLELSPGKYVKGEEELPVDPEEEEIRGVYWSVYVMDRLIHVEADILNKHFHLPYHKEDDLLPTAHYIWDPTLKSSTNTIKRYPAQVHDSVALGPFQRNIQCAILWSRAVEWERLSHDPKNPPSISSFAMIDIATRNMIQAMIRQAPRWGDHYACFASLTITLLLLYGRYLKTVTPPEDESQTSVETAMAVAGLNFTVRMITDTTSDYNKYLAERPELLGPCSPVMPYSLYHCLLVLQRFEKIIPESDQRFYDLYSSLHFYAKRWGVGGQLVQRLEKSLSQDLQEEQR